MITSISKVQMSRYQYQNERELEVWGGKEMEEE